MSVVEFVSVSGECVAFEGELLHKIDNSYFAMLTHRGKSPYQTSLTLHNLVLAHLIAECGHYPGMLTIETKEILPEPIEGEPRIVFETFEEFCDFLGIDAEVDYDCDEDFLVYFGIWDDSYNDMPDEEEATESDTREEQSFIRQEDPLSDNE